GRRGAAHSRRRRKRVRRRAARLGGDGERLLVDADQARAPRGARAVSSTRRNTAGRADSPVYFIGEQPYWTVVGADAADAEALVGEDGNVEPFKGGEAIEPFFIVKDKRLTEAGVGRQ